MNARQADSAQGGEKKSKQKGKVGPRAQGKQFSRMWIAFLRLPLSAAQYKEVLSFLHERVLPCISLVLHSEIPLLPLASTVRDNAPAQRSSLSLSLVGVCMCGYVVILDWEIWMILFS
jgi:hypothetical protein